MVLAERTLRRPLAIDRNDPGPPNRGTEKLHLPGFGSPPEAALNATPLTSYLQLRGGIDTCDTLDDAVGTLAEGLPAGAAVVALGGYRRREQCLWSDVDIMVLHEGGDTESLVRAVLYPLWDANLKVGRAVRTVAECRARRIRHVRRCPLIISRQRPHPRCSGTWMSRPARRGDAPDRRSRRPGTGAGRGPRSLRVPPRRNAGVHGRGR